MNSKIVADQMEHVGQARTKGNEEERVDEENRK